MSGKMAAIAGSLLLAFQMTAQAAVPMPASTPADQRALRTLVQEIKKTTRGQTVVAYTRQQYIRLHPFTGTPDDPRAGRYDNETHTLNVDVSVPSEIEAISIFSHEVEHIRQDKELNAERIKKRATPQQLWEILQFEEAGACAAAADFVSDYVLETGIPISAENLKDTQLRVASELVALKRQSLNRRLTTEQYYTAAFAPCAAPALENGYSMNHIMGYLERRDEAKAAEKRGKALPQPLSDSDMTAFLKSYINNDFSSLNLDPTPMAYQGLPESLVKEIANYDAGYRAVLAKNKVQLKP